MRQQIHVQAETTFQHYSFLFIYTTCTESPKSFHGSMQSFQGSMQSFVLVMRRVKGGPQKCNYWSRYPNERADLCGHGNDPFSLGFSIYNGCDRFSMSCDWFSMSNDWFSRIFMLYMLPYMYPGSIAPFLLGKTPKNHYWLLQKVPWSSFRFSRTFFGLGSLSIGEKEKASPKWRRIDPISEMHSYYTFIYLYISQNHAKSLFIAAYNQQQRLG